MPDLDVCYRSESPILFLMLRPNRRLMWSRCLKPGALFEELPGYTLLLVSSLSLPLASVFSHLGSRPCHP